MNRIEEISGTHVSRLKSEKDRLISDYITVAMTEADSVDIMVGYFRLGFFQHFALLFVLLYRSKKKMRIICGHQLGPDEEKLIFDNGTSIESDSAAEKILNRIWNGVVENSLNMEDMDDVYTLVRHLLKTGILSIKPVLVLNGETSVYGLFHHKEYFFHTTQGISYATGSFNMTARAVDFNSENLKVEFVCSADGPSFEDVSRRFDVMNDIWNDAYPGYVKASKKDIVLDSFDKSNVSLKDAELNGKVKSLINGFRDEISDEIAEYLESFLFDLEEEEVAIKLRPHQKEALKKWQEAAFSGLLEMATGAGKTITAISGVSNLEEALGHQFPIVILVPSKGLADQWHTELSKFLPDRVIICTSGAHIDREWKTVFRVRLELFGAKQFDAAPILIGYYPTVLKHLSLLKQQEVGVIKPLEETLLIADECHTIGAPSSRKSFIHAFFNYRIGLSATPDRYMDEEGTQFVRSVFNALPESTFKYGLSDAIADGFLVPYNYEPVPFVLDQETQQAYADISQRINTLLHAEEGTPASKLLEQLLIARVRLIMKAPAKKEAFRNWIEERIKAKDPRLRAMIVYAPEGFGDEEADFKVIDEYHEILHDNGLKATTFTGEGLSNKEMDSPLEVFQRGGLDALIAMKCLDEGVDLPRATCGVFLSSTGNTRQYIQRRGRLIRLYEDDAEKKMSASVVDFICIPETDNFSSDLDSVRVEQSILKRELFRAAQFSKDALNQSEAEMKIAGILDQLNYAHLWDEQLLN